MVCMLIQVRSTEMLLQLRTWVRALTTEVNRARDAAGTSDVDLTLAISRALEVLSRVSELVNSERSAA